MDCIFCKIVSKEIPGHVVYEDSHSMAFLDIEPSAPGHTMVIPKSHRRNILELEQPEVHAIFENVQKLTRSIEKALTPDGFTLGINHGKGGRVEVDHLHIHIIPRFLDDNGKDIQAIVSNPSEKPLEDVAQKIREQVPG